MDAGNAGAVRLGSAAMCRPTFPLPLAALALGLLAGSLPPGSAIAQMSPTSPRGAPFAPNVQQNNRPPPAALPGLVGRQAPQPIPGDPTRTLSPNGALFDAINRGDLAAAREAVARGADLGARNVLGLTPLDAAVDQGRNEIMFYLLSVRGAAYGSRGGPVDDGAPVRPSRQPREPRQVRREPAPAPEPRSAAPARPAPAQNPRLWANDGGSANPDRGFLGFDAGRSGSAPAGDARRGRAGGG